jgi:hypothetical protein
MAPCAVAGGAETRSHVNPQGLRPAAARLLSLIGWRAARHPREDQTVTSSLEGARKPAAAPLDIGKDAVATLGAQSIQALSEKAFVVHRHCAPSIPGAATRVQRALRNATRSAFCWSVNPMSNR